jgi:hypothetical protein
MSPADLWRLGGAAAMALGLAGVFRAWRGRGGRAPGRRLGLAAGWLLVALGVGLWARAAGDVGAAQAVAAAMLLALAGVGAHGLVLSHPRKPPRETRTEAGVAPPTPGSAAHAAARLAGSLAAAPAFGLLTGLQVCRLGAGAEATRLVGFAFVAVLAAALGLVWVLASARPIRVTAALAGTAFLLALLLAVPGGAA